MQTSRILIPVFMAGALLGCDGSEQQKIELPEPTGATGPSVEVTALRVQYQETSAPLVVTGTSRPARAADLAPAMTARIERVLVDEGDQVKAGQPLVRLDARTANLSAAQAAEAAAAAQAQADQLEADYQRLAPLAERGAIPRSRVDQLDSQRSAAKAQARAASAAANAAAQVAQNATLRAPFAGRVVDVPVEVGEMSSMAPGAKLVRLVDLSSIEVAVPVSEQDLGRVRVGDRVVARFPRLSREVEIEGEIVHVGFEVDQATRTAEVVARIPNPDESLRAGLFAQIAIRPTSTRTAMIVPRAAVGGSGDARYVYVIDGDTARRRPVRAAEFDRDHYEIVDGLSDGELIAAARIGRLSDGAEVTISGEGERAAAPAPTEGERAAAPAPTEGERAAAPAPTEGERVAAPTPADSDGEGDVTAANADDSTQGQAQ